MPQKVLVVDDDKVARTIMADGIREMGYAVEIADSAISGLDKCEREAFDLVITDIVMPDRDGTSLIVEIRKRFPQTRIVAVSGAVKTQYIDYLDMARRVGAHSTLAKPFSFEQLGECVRTLLGTPRAS